MGYMRKYERGKELEVFRATWLRVAKTLVKEGVITIEGTSSATVYKRVCSITDISGIPRPTLPGGEKPMATTQPEPNTRNISASARPKNVDPVKARVSSSRYTSVQERGSCAETDPEAFFPEKGGSTKEAKRICDSCEVRIECLEYALDNNERFGIWGGLSEKERRRLKKEKRNTGTT